MPVMNEWDKSKKLTNELRNDIINASIKFCFEPLNDIFKELYIVLAWDLYHIQTPADLLVLYNENKETMKYLIEQSTTFSINGIGQLPSFNNNSYSRHRNWNLTFPIPLPILAEGSRRYSQHALKTPPEGTNKKERALYTRYTQLKTDIKIFREKIDKFHTELQTALNNCTSTKQFIDQNPEFEGYMKQSLKKFYSDTHPNVINSLNSAMNVRTYASLTSGHRLQAYQQSMLAQLQPLELRHSTIQVSDTAQA